MVTWSTPWRLRLSGWNHKDTEESVGGASAEGKLVERKKHTGKTAAGDGCRAPLSILFLIKVFRTHSSARRWVRRPLALVGKALAGFLPAAGGAPLVLALHAVDLAAFLGLAAALPDERGGVRKARGRARRRGGEAAGAADASPEGAVGAGGRRAHGLEPVLLEPLFADADGPAARLRRLKAEGHKMSVGHRQASLRAAEAFI